MPHPFPSRIDRTVGSKLLAWFDRNRRQLPWRKNRTPYRVWISEIMLQQTQVATVIPYFERFLRRFPTIRDLARAPLTDVLSHWAGLGYYSRARNLHRAAREMMRRHSGEVPQSFDALRDLPGIGRYTAGAIASIAFGQQAAVVDGNVSRVLTRLFDISDDISAALGQQSVWRLAESLMPRRRCGDHNEALMELGATVCLAGSAARCGQCPLRSRCLARLRGTIADRPVKGRRPKIQSETHVMVAIQRRDRWLCRVRPPEGLWAGLWELPSAVLTEDEPRNLAKKLARDVLTGRLDLEETASIQFERQLTHRRIEFLGFLGRASAAARCNSDGYLKWMTLPELSRQGVSRAVREAISLLPQNRRGRIQRDR